MHLSYLIRSWSPTMFQHQIYTQSQILRKSALLCLKNKSNSLSLFLNLMNFRPYFIKKTLAINLQVFWRRCDKLNSKLNKWKMKNQNPLLGRDNNIIIIMLYKAAEKYLVKERKIQLGSLMMIRRRRYLWSPNSVTWYHETALQTWQQFS